ncbi:MAG: DsbA family protein, partial [Steroidobacterales bacterium]
AVLAKHPDDVRLVFRHLPLTSLHPNAQIAAEAAVCADAQGKFWEMHDAMFGDQNSLAASSLKQTAQRLGLDTGQFASCLSDAKTSQTVATDARAANALGVSGTPSFFINGRLIDGNVPQEQFEALIGEELQRAPNRRGG